MSLQRSLKGKKDIVTSGTSGNRCWVFHQDPFPTDTGNFNLTCEFKIFGYDSKKPLQALFVVLHYCIFLVAVIVVWFFLTEESLLG